MSYLLWQGFRDSADAHPDRPAISDGRSEMSYAELRAGADGVAAALTEAGLRPGDHVGVLAPKSTRCVAAMLGVSTAGGCYVPVDPKAPAVRSRYILGNANARFLVSDSRLMRRLEMEPGTDGIPEAPRILVLDDGADDPADGGGSALGWADVSAAAGDFAPPARMEDDPAYILYTSGSTGNPKGVVISHRNALTFVDWARETFSFTSEDRLSNHAPFHFDLSVLDLHGAFSVGASVHVVHDAVRPFPGALAKWIHDTEISVWYSVPSALVRLYMHGELERFDYERLRTILFAGEVFPTKHLRRVMEAFPHSEFHNLYGPTETNVCTFYSVPRPLPGDVGDLPIGETCANMEAFALTDDGAEAAVGEEGELLVRGPCVMLGYWGLPERTAESMGQNPLHADFVDTVYRTGDRVRVLPDGDFEFLGRRDHMVKVGGYRVELGEVEHALNDHPQVREAAVVAVEHEELGATLAAGVVTEDGSDLQVSELHKHCMGRVPRYAVPETITLLEALPRTSTGKIDRVTLKTRLS